MEYNKDNSEKSFSRDRNFKPRGPREGGFERRRRDDFKPRFPREGGFEKRDDFKPRAPREGWFERRRRDDFKPRFPREGGFERKEGSFERKDNNFTPRSPREGGFQRRDGFRPRFPREGSRDNGGFRPRFERRSKPTVDLNDPVFRATRYATTIVEIVANEHGRPIPIGIIIGKIEDKQGVVYKKNFFDDLDSLVAKGDLIQLENKRIVIGYPKAEADMDNIFKGTISINAKQFGFITKEDAKESTYFVHRSNLNGAFDGDSVEFAALKIPPKEGKQSNLVDAIVLKVLSHKKNHYVGTYKVLDTGYQIQCDDPKMYLPIKLDDTQGITDGIKFLFEVIEFKPGVIIGKIAKIIGHTSDVGSDILSIVYDNGIDSAFTDEVLEQAKAISLDIDQHQRKIRKDLTHLDIVTIDPTTSKDFDDAVYVEQLENNQYKLFVSISDVSHYVKWDSLLDTSAQNRGCSVYLVDRVIPMLPHNLSDDVCSLNPNVERLTLTCEMVIDNHGAFKNIDVYPSIIKSHRRFTYDEVNAYFEKQDMLEKDTESVKSMLDVSKQLHDILTTAKNKRGYLDFDIPEPIIVLDEKGLVKDVVIKKSGEAQKMIEDFMVAANEAVTIFAQKKQWPFVFRTHDSPKEERVSAFVVEARKLGFKIPSSELKLEQNTISKWLEANLENPNRDLINLLLLRTMAKAEYTTTNIGHFGLASENYTHFTSPIRRYPDLLVHRIYWMNLFEKEQYTDSQREKLAEQLNMICSKANERELVAVQTERDVNALKFAQYMQNHVGETFEAKVSTVTNFGMFISLPNTIEGLIRIVNLKDDFYTFDEERFCLTGKNKKQVFTLGTKIKARCISASTLERKIEFELIEKI